jgi:hypothetical protein
MRLRLRVALLVRAGLYDAVVDCFLKLLPLLHGLTRLLRCLLRSGLRLCLLSFLRHVALLNRCRWRYRSAFANRLHCIPITTAQWKKQRLCLKKCVHARRSRGFLRVNPASKQRMQRPSHFHRAPSSRKRENVKNTFEIGTSFMCARFDFSNSPRKKFTRRAQSCGVVGR